MRRTDSLGKTLMLGKIDGRKRRGWQRKRWLDDITDSTGMSVSKLKDILKDRERSLACYSPWGHKELDTTEQLNNQNDITNTYPYFFKALFFPGTLVLNLGWFCPLGDIYWCLETFWIVAAGAGCRYWCLVGVGQGCYSTTHKAQVSPHRKDSSVLTQVLILLLLRSTGVEGSNKWKVTQLFVEHISLAEEPRLFCLKAFHIVHLLGQKAQCQGPEAKTQAYSCVSLGQQCSVFTKCVANFKSQVLLWKDLDFCLLLNTGNTG